jgi:dTDP-D-glucose 4,6-dehydratase
MKQFTPWQPEYSLRQGLEKTIDWFRKSENLLKYKPGVYNL